jgi:uncharacterized protein with ParB-like and HNH nuclease domain
MSEKTTEESDELDNLPNEEEYTPPSISESTRIISYNVSNTVEILISKIKNNEIDLQPEFQREFVWDKKRCSFFIDSLIIGLPIPSIFLGKRKNEETFFVIDGQQRLKTIYSFFTGLYGSLDSTTKFKLIGLDKKKYNLHTYDELDEVDKRKFKNAVLNTTIIENIEDDPVIVNDIFHRLNTGGMPLNDQEIRNCIYRGPFNEYLIALNQNVNWRKLLGRMSPNKRLRDIELVLRFVTLYSSYQEYKEPLRDYLHKFMEDNIKGIPEADKVKQVFDETCEIIVTKIGADAFRLKKYFNRALCDAVLLGVAMNITNKSLSNNLKEQHQKLVNDKGMLMYVTVSTTLESNLKGRIDTAIRFFKE